MVEVLAALTPHSLRVDDEIDEQNRSKVDYSYVSWAKENCVLGELVVAIYRKDQIRLGLLEMEYSKDYKEQTYYVRFFNA